MTTKAEVEDDELRIIRARISKIDAERSRLLKRAKEIEDGRARRKFTCACVRLNKDIDIGDMSEQHAAGRRGLQLGLVAETLSALEDCARCGGSGIPKGDA